MQQKLTVSGRLKASYWSSEERARDANKAVGSRSAGLAMSSYCGTRVNGTLAVVSVGMVRSESVMMLRLRATVFLIYSRIIVLMLLKLDEYRI